MPVISSCSLYFWVIQWNLRMSSPWRAFAEVSQCPWVCPFSIFAHFQQKALTLNNAVLSLGYMGGNYLHTSLGVIPFLGWHDKCFSISDRSSTTSLKAHSGHQTTCQGTARLTRSETLWLLKPRNTNLGLNNTSSVSKVYDPGPVS